jgi:5-methylcytosine-specific restriction endonuclease McrA
MSNRYRLIAMGNEELVDALSALLRRENDLLSDTLAHLAELDDRRLYLELGFASMFAYCTDALGLCKSSAYRRIAAARLCRRFPELFARVAAGELQTSVLAALSRHVTPQNAAELFAACSRKSCDQVEELLASRFPRPDVPDSIRRLPTRDDRTRGAATIDPARVSLPGSSMGNSSTAILGGVTTDPPRVFSPGSSIGNLGPVVLGDPTTARTDPSAPPPAEPSAVPGARVGAPAQRKLEPLSEERFGVHFTADGEFKRLLDEVRALASHRLPNADLSHLMTRALEAYRGELLKERYGVGRRALRSKRVAVTAGAIIAGLAKRPRHVPAAVAREVYLRDGGCCTFCAANGQHCSATRLLELDHIIPWAEGGASTVENLRLRCRAHNQYGARKYFGTASVDAAIRARRARLKTDGCSAHD